MGYPTRTLRGNVDGQTITATVQGHHTIDIDYGGQEGWEVVLRHYPSGDIMVHTPRGQAPMVEIDLLEDVGPC